jgi:uncharacterized damage-inducible protein DinB
MDPKQLVETWEIHNRINAYLLDAIDKGSLKDVPIGSKGRSVGEQLAHLHNVRLMWLKAAQPDLLKGLDKIEKDAAADKALLKGSFESSGKAIGRLIESACVNGGKVKGFKPHVAAFVGYLISHESHHRGQIMLSLKQSGHAVDKKIQYGLWEWGSR